MSDVFSCPLSLKSLGREGSFSGYASVFDVMDSDCESVAHGAFKKSLRNWEKKGKLPKLLWQHNCQKPIGLWHEIREDPYGLYVNGQLLLDLNQGREAYSLLKNGVIDGLSIGFITVRARHPSPGTARGKQVVSAARILEEVDLQEVSLVTFAANPAARIRQVKMEDRELKDILKRLDELGNLLKGKKQERRQVF